MIKIPDLKAVFFDADDTLFRIKGGVGKAYADIFGKYGVLAAPCEVERVIIEVYTADSNFFGLEERYLSNHQQDYEWWKKFCLKVVSHFGKPRNFKALYEELYSFFACGSSRELNHAVTDLVTHYREMGFRTGVLTNNDKRIHSLVEDLDIHHHFDYILCASDIGYRKPSPHSFEGARKKVGFQPEQMLYIGDSLHDDVFGARQAGWNAVWYNPHEKEPHIPNLEPLVAVRCFTELVTKKS